MINNYLYLVFNCQTSLECSFSLFFFFFALLHFNFLNAAILFSLKLEFGARNDMFFLCLCWQRKVSHRQQLQLSWWHSKNSLMKMMLNVAGSPSGLKTLECQSSLPVPDLKFQLQTAFLTMCPCRGHAKLSFLSENRRQHSYYSSLSSLCSLYSFFSDACCCSTGDWCHRSWRIMNVWFHCDALRLQKQNFWGILADIENIFARMPVSNIFPHSRFF